MTEKEIPPDKKAAADVMLGLFNRAWTNFHDRRAYEWKLSFGIWTALAIFAAFIFRGEVAWGVGSRHALGFGLVALLGIQWFFEYRIKRANDMDAARAHDYEKRLNAMVGVDFKEGEVGEAYRKMNTKWRMKGWWSLGFHLGITLLLCGAVFLSTYLSRKSIEVVNDAAEIKVRAERRAGIFPRARNEGLSASSRIPSRSGAGLEVGVAIPMYPEAGSGLSRCYSIGTCQAVIPLAANRHGLQANRGTRRNTWDGA